MVQGRGVNALRASGGMDTTFSYPRRGLDHGLVEDEHQSDSFLHLAQESRYDLPLAAYRNVKLAAAELHVTIRQQ